MAGGSGFTARNLWGGPSLSAVFAERVGSGFTVLFVPGFGILTWSGCHSYLPSRYFSGDASNCFLCSGMQK